MTTPSTAWPPRGLTGRLVRRVAPAGLPPDAPAARMALGEFEGYVSTVLSVALTLTKAALGWISGSISLVADALNNLADVGSSLIVAFGFRWSQKPRDREHPFGHGRVETVAQMILSIILIGVAIEVARAGVGRLRHPEPCHAPWWLTASIVVTVLVKAWLARFARILAKATRSQVLEADSWNHTFDIACTLLVVVALLGSYAGWVRLDGYAALGVSFFIAWTGYRYARHAVNTLIGEAPADADLARVRSLAAGVEGVRGVHDVIVHAYGDVRLISFHIEVDAHLTLLAAHDLGEAVERKVAEAFAARTVAHVDPVDRSHPGYAQAEALLRELLSGHAELAGFHDLRLAGPEGRYDLSVDFVARAHVASAEFGGILEGMCRQLHGRLPAARRVDLGLETEFASENELRRVFRQDEAP